MREKFHLVIFLTFLISTTAYAQKVAVDYDQNANFSSYKTYSWGQGTPALNPLGHQRIVAGIEAQLAAKGWQKVESDPDVMVIYSAATTTETQINTFDSGGPWGGYRRGWGGGISTTTVEKIPLGQLVVDMADVKNKSFIWRGTASDTLSDKPEKNQKKLEKVLTKMFKKFPPTPATK